MGKRRVANKKGQQLDQGLKARALARLSKRKLESGKLHIQATFNNTMITLTDAGGNAVISSSAGALGFKGTKKSTPYAASKVGELVGEKAKMIGLKYVDVVIKGVGQGRESAIRSFSAAGVDVNTIVDRTPVPHNGCRPPKPRRV